LPGTRLMCGSTWMEGEASPGDRRVVAGARTAAGGGRPQAGLEDVEKVLTAIMAGAGGELRGQAGAPSREPFWLDRHDG
jgi:hypothetical protein